MKNPSSWSNGAIKGWITESSGTPPIDANILAVELTGIQLCKLSQKEFISRCLQTPGVAKDQAIALYQKLRRFHINSRYQSSTFEATEEEQKVQESTTNVETTPFQNRIKPGMFVRLVRAASKMESGDFVMIMSPCSSEDFNNAGDHTQFVCVQIGPSVMAGAYELHVVKQIMYSVKDMAAEVLMEYDFATRYYYMNL